MIISPVFIFKNCVVSWCLITSLTAQDITPPKQVPSSKEGLKNTVETAAKALQPELRADSPRLQLLRKRAAEARARQQAHLQAVSEGKVKPWQDLIDKQAEIAISLQALQTKVTSFQNEKDPLKRETLQHMILTALRLVGPYLQDADFHSYDPTLTADQVQELTILESTLRYPENPSSLEGSLISLSPQQNFTLTGLPVPLRLQAPPNATIYAYSGGGGTFPNGLAIQQITADKEGNVLTSWVTHGDSAGLSVIELTSPECSNAITFNIQTVKLAPIPISIPTPVTLPNPTLPKTR